MFDVPLEAWCGILVNHLSIYNHTYTVVKGLTFQINDGLPFQCMTRFGFQLLFAATTASIFLCYMLRQRHLATWTNHYRCQSQIQITFLYRSNLVHFNGALSRSISDLCQFTECPLEHPPAPKSFDFLSQTVRYIRKRAWFSRYSVAFPFWTSSMFSNRFNRLNFRTCRTTDSRPVFREE